MKIKTNSNLKDTIFFNHFNFLFENKNQLNTSKNYIEYMRNRDNYNKYINCLFENIELDKDDKYILDILDRERSSLLEEANIADSGYAVGYATMYFPILCDTYLSEVLYKAITHYTVKEPFLTIPRFKLTGKVTNSDGSIEEHSFPRVRYLVRSKRETLPLKPLTNNNLFKLSQSYPNLVNNKNCVINRRFFILDTLELKIIDKNSQDHILQIDLNYRPDNRNQIFIEKSIDFQSDTINLSILGNINWESGDLVYNIAFKSEVYNDIQKIEIIALNSKVLFSATTGDISRVKVSCSMHGHDIYVDVREDFEFDLNVEMLQDYADIYNIQLVRTISEAIKQQILLNRDQDIAYLLDENEPEMKKNNCYEILDLSQYYTNKGLLTPNYLKDILEMIIPRLSIIKKFIYFHNAYNPQYLLTGIRSAALLENLQNYIISMPEQRYGVIGLDNQEGLDSIEDSFLRYKIICSPAIPDDKIYIIYKPDTPDITTDNPHLLEASELDLLRQMVLCNIIYKPLYSVEEITNSKKRNFIRSRSALEVTHAAGLGCLEIKGFQHLLTDHEIVLPGGF